jgi:transposase
LNVEKERVDVWVGHKRGKLWPCPKCRRRLPCRDHAAERIWRHLNTCQFRTFLHAHIPRFGMS